MARAFLPPHRRILSEITLDKSSILMLKSSVPKHSEILDLNIAYPGIEKFCLVPGAFSEVDVFDQIPGSLRVHVFPKFPFT